MFSPEAVPVTVILMDAPEGFAIRPKQTIRPETILRSAVLAMRGRMIVLDEGCCHHRVWLPSGRIPVRPAALVPLDEDFELRIHALKRLHRWMAGEVSGPLARTQQLTPYRRRRLVEMLRALDGHLSGAGSREIAAVLFDPSFRTLAAIDWKTDPYRMRVSRLLVAAKAMTDGGYLLLLRGEGSNRKKPFRRKK